MQKIIILYSIIIIFNIFWVFSFFIKLVGIETKRWSTAISIFQIINLFPRTIGIFQVPLITLYTETAINSNQKLTPLFYQGIVFFNLIGVLLGTVLLPFFIHSLKETIKNIYESESFRIILKKEIWKLSIFFFKKPDYHSFFVNTKAIKINNKPLFLNNTIAAFLLSIALPACVLAGYNIPSYRATIISLVSIIYGISSVVTILLIDTKVSLLTDKTFHGNLSVESYKTVLFDCLKGRIIGTFLGILLLPIFSDLITQIIKLFIHK